jgi:hypothetical protein
MSRSSIRTSSVPFRLDLVALIILIDVVIAGPFCCYIFVLIPLSFPRETIGDLEIRVRHDCGPITLNLEERDLTAIQAK